MAGVILCRTRVAKNPFYISNMDINIYSMEELCYYIYNNIYVIGLDLMDDDLIGFIHDELGEEGLAQKLSYLKKAKAGLAEIVITILKYVDYYELSEIEQIRDILENLNTQNVYERLKMRGDTLFANEKYVAAIKNYELIINGEKDPMLPGIFYTKVYHNLGCAYGNMFLYDKARQNFKYAYDIGQHEESKKCLIAACLLEEGYSGEEFYNPQDEESFVFSREIETVLDGAMECPRCTELYGLDNLKRTDGEAYYKEIKKILDSFKEDYSRFTS